MTQESHSNRREVLRKGAGAVATVVGANVVAGTASAATLDNKLFIEEEMDWSNSCSFFVDFEYDIGEHRWEHNPGGCSVGSEGVVVDGSVADSSNYDDTYAELVFENNPAIVWADTDPNEKADIWYNGNCFYGPQC